MACPSNDVDCDRGNIGGENIQLDSYLHNKILTDLICNMCNEVAELKREVTNLREALLEDKVSERHKL